MALKKETMAIDAEFATKMGPQGNVLMIRSGASVNEREVRYYTMSQEEYSENQSTIPFYSLAAVWGKANEKFAESDALRQLWGFNARGGPQILKDGESPLAAGQIPNGPCTKEHALAVFLAFTQKKGDELEKAKDTVSKLLDGLDWTLAYEFMIHAQEVASEFFKKERQTLVDTAEKFKELGYTIKCVTNPTHLIPKDTGTLVYLCPFKFGKLDKDVAAFKESAKIDPENFNLAEIAEIFNSSIDEEKVNKDNVPELRGRNLEWFVKWATESSNSDISERAFKLLDESLAEFHCAIWDAIAHQVVYEAIQSL